LVAASSGGFEHAMRVRQARLVREPFLLGAITFNEVSRLTPVLKYVREI